MIDLNLALQKPYDLMTDDEFDAVMDYERWVQKAKYSTKQHVSLGEAFEVFKEDLYELAMDLQDMDLLYQFKKWRSGSYLDKDKAKAYPIEQVAMNQGIDVRRPGFIVCPFHEDNTASLKLYKDTNTYYCFGCNKGGDVISFLMGLQKISFTQAIKQLI